MPRLQRQQKYFDLARAEVGSETIGLFAVELDAVGSYTTRLEEAD